MYTADDILKLARRRPFIPFRILTSGGDSFLVPHPDMIWIGTRYVQVGTPNPDKPSFYDTSAHLAILHITGIQDLPVPAGPATGNGQVA